MYSELSQELFLLGQSLNLGIKPAYVKDKNGIQRMVWVSREPTHYIDYELRAKGAEHEGVYWLEDDTSIQRGMSVIPIGPRYQSLEELKASSKIIEFSPLILRPPTV